MNMPINLHFFRSTQTGRIQYEKILDFFQERPNFEIYYEDDKVDIIYTDNEFGFQYEYKITKVSQVTAIYKIDPSFLNINFMLCLPLLIPEFPAKEIITLASQLAREFELSVYHSSFENVRPFNIADIQTLFLSCRQHYLDENPENDKLFMDVDELNHVCRYQRNLDRTYEFFHQDYEVHHCVPIIDRKNDEFGICTFLNFGIPTVFAPYYKFVEIKDEQGEVFKIRRADFLKYMEKYLTRIENNMPDYYYIKKKQAKASKSVLGKLKKFAITDQYFEKLRLCDIIDKRK